MKRPVCRLRRIKSGQQGFLTLKTTYDDGEPPRKSSCPLRVVHVCPLCAAQSCSPHAAVNIWLIRINIAVRYTNDPELIKPRPPDGHLPQPPEHMNLETKSRVRGQASQSLLLPVTHHALGAIPPAFKIHHPETLARLDNIETIVVLMMENRSFDHMLGYLRNTLGDKYEGLHGYESNLPPAGVSGGNIPVRKASAEPLLDYQNTGRPLTQIMISPYHGHSHVMAQVNGD
jgi:hypothetical protein